MHVAHKSDCKCIDFCFTWLYHIDINGACNCKIGTVGDYF